MIRAQPEYNNRRITKTGSDYDDHVYTYDPVGNLTGDTLSQHRGSVTSGSPRNFVYDAFGRLVAVTGIVTDDGPTSIANRYNGLGFRIMSQEDDNASGSLDSAERRYLMYDERWRVVAAFRDQDAAPKESYVYHAAGWNGSGDAAYIDSVILRDRDNTSCGSGCDPRSAASDGVLEERRFYCQNWRADVVAIAAADGTPVETVRYSAYGEPTVYPMADLNMDGTVDSADLNAWIDLAAGGSPDIAYTGDIDFDGYYDAGTSPDDGEFYDSYNANLGLSGKGRLSTPSVDNRIGYAGYQWDQAVRADHVRYRVYLPEIGRWTRRDPIGYGGTSTNSMYVYADGRSETGSDPFALSFIYPPGYTPPSDAPPSMLPGPSPENPSSCVGDQLPDFWDALNKGNVEVDQEKRNEEVRKWEDHCTTLLRAIRQAQQMIERQYRNIELNPKSLPWSAPKDWLTPRLSVRGHYYLVRVYTKLRDALIQTWRDNGCNNPNPPYKWKPIERPTIQPVPWTYPIPVVEIPPGVRGPIDFFPPAIPVPELPESPEIIAPTPFPFPFIPIPGLSPAAPLAPLWPVITRPIAI